MAYVGNIDSALEKYLNSGGVDSEDADENKIIFERKDQLAQLTEIAIVDKSGAAKTSYNYEDEIYVLIKYLVSQDTRNIAIRFSLSRNGELLFLTQDSDDQTELLGRKDAGNYTNCPII